MNRLKDGSYRWVLWCGLVLGISSLALMSQHGELTATGPEWIDALWVAGDKGLLKIDVSDASPLLEIADVGDVRAVDIDARRGLVWIFSKDRLLGITFGGEVLFVVPEHHEDRKDHDRDNDDDDDDDDDDGEDRDGSHFKLRGKKPFGLQVNSNTGTVWLGLERLLHQFDSEANWVRTLRLPGQGQALALDELTSFLWVATRGALLCYDETGTLVRFIDLGRKARVEDIDIDRDSGDIWVVGKNGLSRWDITGQLVFEAKNKKLTRVVTDYRGGVWLAGGKTLIHINPFGEPFFELKPFGKKGKELLALVADPLNGSVWVASKEQVAHVSAAGKILQSLESKGSKRRKGRIRDLALYLDLMAPQVAITSPPPGVLINNPRPVFMLTLTDIGEGVDPSTLELKVNGEKWSFNCVVDDEKEGATCVPIMVLPEGVIEVSATVQDLNGNLSDPVQVSVTVDSIPPEVLFVTPSQDAILDTDIPDIQVDYGDSGSGVDPSTFTIQADGDNLDIKCDVGLTSSTCAPVTTLPEGLHTLSATIRDLAGNISSPTRVRFTVELFVIPQPPVLDPIGDQTVDLGSILTLTLMARDPNGDPLTFAAALFPLPANMALHALTGLFSFIPDEDQIGILNVTFIVSDGVFTDSQAITITVLGPDSNGVTALIGRVLDTNDFVQGVQTPVVGATISLLATGFSTTSDADGNFILNGIPSGSQILDIDSSTASLASDGSPYAGFRETIWLFQGANNVVDRPFFLPRIEQESLTQVDPGTTTIVKNSRLGITMTVFSFSSRNPDGSFFNGELSISEVPRGLAPAALPKKFHPGLLVTIQPVGVTFSTPARITFPNIDDLRPGTDVDIWSLSPETGGFVIVGLARVSADGLTLVTISGGIRSADWHFFLPPAPTVNSARESSENNSENQDQNKCTDCPGGSRTAVSSGNLRIDHTLASYRSLGQSRALRVLYNSSRANPQPVMSATAVILPRAAVPQSVSSRLSVAGVDQGIEVFTDTSGLGAGTEIRQAVQFDASRFQTGLYPYQLTLTGHYTRSAVSNVLVGNVLINNQQGSPFGAGWTLEGLERLKRHNADILLTKGDGSVLVFTATGAFSAPTNFLIGGTPRSMVVEDFDGDGIPDLAVANVSRVAVLLGDGAGGFLSPSYLRAGTLPVSVAVGDFNGDEIPDLAVASQVADIVSILLGDGTGAFSSPTHFPAGSLPLTVEVKDFNGDGNLDLVVVNRADGIAGGNTVSILLGDGTGVFSRPSHFQVEGRLESVAVGDFNGDGILDLVAPKGLSDTVSILLGDGTGAFSRPTHFPAGDFPVSVAVGDFNNNGILDLAVANVVSGDVSILLGDGTGAFLGPFNVKAGVAPSSVIVGDFNDDKIRDLAVANRISDTVSILLGDGTGAFVGPVHVEVGDGPVGVVAGDFNGDAIPDLATTNAFSRDVSILLGGFSGRTVFESPQGDFSTLLENRDGTFNRILKDGTQISFSSNGLQTSITDRNGNTTYFTYDAGERLTIITDPSGLATTFSYGGGLLNSIRGPAGRVTQFEHDAAGNMTRISDPDGTSRSFDYDSRHQLIAQTSKPGFQTTYAYDLAGRNVGVKRPDGSTRGIVPSETIGVMDPSSGVGTPENPASVVSPGDAESRFIDGNGSTTRFVTNRFGATTATTDALGRQTLIERDVDSNPIRIVRSNGAVTTMTYDDRGNLLTSTKQAFDATTTFTYDPVFNQVSSVTDPKGSVTTINYDSGGNPIEVIDAQGTGTVMTYDDLNCPGQLTSVTAAVGLAEENTTRFEYDPATCNLVSTIDPLLNETRLGYDAAGNVIESTDAGGRITRFAYDALNRLTKVMDAIHSSPDPLCGTAGVTCYDYDSAGSLTQVTDARGSVTTFDYDTQDRLIQTTDPLGRSETFAYDGNGNLISSTDRNNQTIEFQYDAVNQLIQKTLLPGMPDEALTRFGYDSVGNLASVVDPDSSLTMTYDQLARLGSISTTGSPNQPDVTLDYTYDKNGNRLTMTGPHGQTEYVYDDLNRLTHLTNPSVQTVNFDYDALGRRTQMSLPNGVTTSYTYDAVSQLLSLVHQLGANTINSFAYTYDNVGNRTSKTENAGTADYTYDPLNRLVEAMNPFPSNPVEVFTYDEVGNRVDSNQNGLSTFNAANQLEEDAEFTYSYDANGNQIRKTNKMTGLLTHFEYDAENRLIQLIREDGRIMRYRYDGLGRRLEKDVAGVVTRYIYDNEDILLELDGSDNILARYTHGPGLDEPLIMERDLDLSSTFEVNETFFYHADGLGSVSELTNIAGTAVETYAYDSFGQISQQIGTLGNPFTYTAREFDSDSSLYFYRARYYDSNTGRFITKDPRLIDSQLNLYPYVKNNPVRFTDPSGEVSPATVPCAIISGIAAAATVANMADLAIDLNKLEDETNRLTDCAKMILDDPAGNLGELERITRRLKDIEIEAVRKARDKAISEFGASVASLVFAFCFAL